MALVGNADTVLSYNGTNFGPYTETTGFTVRPEYDSSGRSVKWYNFSLTFQSKFTGRSAATLASSLRSSLGKPGGVFIYRGRGTGDIQVNTAGVRDVKNGPLPREISYRILGGDAVEMTWGIDFAIPECADAKYIGFPAEFSYSVEFDQDAKGYTTRSIRGRIAIPANRLNPGSDRIADNADRYWEQCIPALQPEFRRRYGPRVLSEDRSELTFSVIDEELRGPAPPPGIFDHDGSCTFSSEDGLGVSWAGVLTYNAELAKDGTTDDAIRASMVFFGDRLQKMTRMTVTQKGKQVPARPIPLSWVIREPSAFKDKNIDITLQFTVASNLEDVLTKSGMWGLTPGHGRWREWSQSLSGSAFNPRGFAKLRFLNDDDRLIDLCGNAKPRLPAGQNILVGGDAVREIVGRIFPPINPAASWIFFRNTISLDQDSGVVTTRTLSTTTLTADTDRVGTMVANGQLPEFFTGSSGVAGGGIGGGGGLPGFVQGRLDNTSTAQGGNSATRVARPTQYVIMEGRAMRAGFRIPEPVLTVVNGVQVLPANRADRGEGFRQKVVWNNGRDEFYFAWWRLRYAVNGDLPNQPLPVAPNPMLE